MEEEKKEQEIKILEIKDKEDLNKLTKQELKEFGTSCLEIINNLVNENENKKEKTIEQKLQLEVNILEVNRRKLLTIFEILGNTSSVLENKVNDSGIKYNRLNLEEDSFNVANNVIRTCLEQLDTWLRENNLNKQDYETGKKQND